MCKKENTHNVPVSSVPCEVEPGEHGEVGVDVSLVVPNDGPCHPWPGGLEAEGALHVVALQLKTLQRRKRKKNHISISSNQRHHADDADLVADEGWLDPEHGPHGLAADDLRALPGGAGRDADAAGLGLPPGHN